MWRAHALIIVMVILAGGIVGVSAELSTEHSVDITGSVDVPAQTIDTERGEITITEIGKEEGENRLNVSTEAPGGESYAIRIIDSEERNLARADGNGNTEASFRVSDNPGIYAVVLTQDGGDTALEVEPFIVKAYTVDQSVSDVTKGESISVDIELTSVVANPADPQAVNVTLFGDDVTRSVEATEINENRYNAEFSTDGLSTGSYDVYTGIETSNDIFGYSELVGVSDSAGVTVESVETSTATSTPESGSGSGSEPVDTPTPTPTPTPDPEPEPEPPVGINNTGNVSNGEASVTFPKQDAEIDETQVSNLPDDVSSVRVNLSSNNPSSASGGLPSDGVSTFLDITPENSTGNGVSVNQDVTVSVTLGDSVINGTDNPALYHDVNSNGTYSELGTEVSEVNNETKLTATTAGLSPFAVAEGSVSIIDEYDTNNNDDISITELGQAGADFASGELSITELGEVGAAFAS